MDEYNDYVENYSYLREKDIKELITIIKSMIDYDEVVEALLIIKSKNISKALELGIEIIEKDKGDEYLQAIVWDYLFFGNEIEMIQAVDNRKKQIGKALLDDVIVDLTNYKSKIKVSNSFLNKVARSYEGLSDEKKKLMRCNFNEFLEVYSKELSQ